MANILVNKVPFAIRELIQGALGLPTILLYFLFSNQTNIIWSGCTKVLLDYPDMAGFSFWECIASAYLFWECRSSTYCLQLKKGKIRNKRQILILGYRNIKIILSLLGTNSMPKARYVLYNKFLKAIITSGINVNRF